MNQEQGQPDSHVLLLGEAEARYGEYHLDVLPTRHVACSLSVGSDPESPSMVSKGHPGVPNEDALLAIESGSRVLLAVADAHHGAFASHVLLRRLEETLEDVPPSPAALMRALQALEFEDQVPREDSASTLLVAVLRREMKAGFGFSYGDSTCAAVGDGLDGRALNRSSNEYVSPAKPGSLSPDRASFFEFQLPPGSLLLAFTDGIDECHYRQPITSLGPRQLVTLFDEVGPDPEAYARRLTEWALAGRDGQPGGQDNIALIVAAS